MELEIEEISKKINNRNISKENYAIILKLLEIENNLSQNPFITLTKKQKQDKENMENIIIKERETNEFYKLLKNYKYELE